MKRVEFPISSFGERVWSGHIYRLSGQNLDTPGVLVRHSGSAANAGEN